MTGEADPPPAPRGAALTAYRAASRLAAPALALATLSASRGGAAALGARFGAGGPADGVPRLWLHGASVGESQATRALLDAARERQPTIPAVATAHTLTGRDAIRAWRAPADAAFAPWDTPGAIGRFLSGWTPAAYASVDSEFWPNRIHALHGARIPIFAAGARVSERSAARWARRAPRAIRALLAAHDLVCPQDEGSAERLLSLGLPAARMGPVETLKSGLRPAAPLPDAETLSAAFPRGRTVMGASTHPGDEALVLAAFGDARRDRPDLRLILAPRHPRRAEEVAALIGAAGFGVLRRTDPVADGLGDPGVVYLVDTLGELRGLYRHAALAFLGGSMGGLGGHTPYEPAVEGCVVAHGPDVEASAGAYAALGGADGAIRVTDARALAAAFALLDAPDRLRAMADRARAALAGPPPVVPGLIAERAVRAIDARRGG